jgi:hypothetical protein
MHDNADMYEKSHVSSSSHSPNNHETIRRILFEKFPMLRPYQLLNSLRHEILLPKEALQTHFLRERVCCLRPLRLKFRFAPSSTDSCTMRIFQLTTASISGLSRWLKSRNVNRSCILRHRKVLGRFWPYQAYRAVLVLP